MEEILVPIFVCVVLPVALVLLGVIARRNEVNRKTEVALKSIEAGVPIDPTYFKTTTKERSTKRMLLGRLTGACIVSLLGVAFLVLGFFGQNIIEGEIDSFLYFFPAGVLLAIGIALFITYFVGKKMLAKEVEAEEKALEDK
ncbi:MAG: hypothetical protein IKX71_03445 [Bacteroidales bacterium]|nr:hypothetical protein [Bacteroidales bacterium]